MEGHPPGLIVTIQDQQYKAQGLQKQLFESLQEEGNILNREAKGLKGTTKSLSERAKEEIGIFLTFCVAFGLGIGSFD